MGIKELPGGLDFFFETRAYAQTMVDFLGSVVPIKSQVSGRQISHDKKSNVYNHKYTFSVEVSKGVGGKILDSNFLEILCGCVMGLVTFRWCLFMYISSFKIKLCTFHLEILTN